MTLSPEMVDAYDAAKANGGILKRYAGGFWSATGYTTGRTFGTSTVNALVKRGAATFTDWQNHRYGGKFPIQITINPLPDSPT